MRLAVAALPLLACIPRPADVPGNIESQPEAAFASLVGVASPIQRITHTNSGPGRTPRLGPPQIVGPGAEHFTIFDDECEGARLLPGGVDQCSTFVQFTPTDLEPVVVELQIDAAHDGPLVTRLVGASAEPQVYTSRADFAFSSGRFVLLDINRDGKLDAASTDGAFILNTGGAVPAFSSPTTIPALYSTNVRAMDINTDGAPDLAFTTADAIAVALNETPMNGSTPSFAAPTSLGTFGNAQALDIADLDGDGRQDIVAASMTGKVVVLHNETSSGATTPVFAAPVELTSVRAMAIAIGNIDGDGKPDIALGGSTPSVVINTSTPGTISVGSPISLPADNIAQVSALSVLDFDRDGLGDVAYAIFNEISLARHVSSGGTRSFERAGIVSAAGAAQLIAGDANGDGAEDLVVAPGNSEVHIYYNATPKGETLAAFAGTALAVDAQTVGVQLAQIRDGKTDLLVGYGSSSNLSVFVAP